MKLESSRPYCFIDKHKFYTFIEKNEDKTVIDG